MTLRERAFHGLALVLACAVIAGCAGPRRAPAPVEERGGVRHPGIALERPAASLPGAENAGKPGYHTVQRGETLVRIALENGQNWRDVARWNGLDNPDKLEVGQVLRVVPPSAATASTAAPLERGAASAPLSAGSASASASAALPASAASGVSRGAVAAAVPATGASAPPEDEIAWGWPTVGAGTVLAGFDEQKNKGIDIGGRAGDPVLASADGRVVYAGAGLRGYGNLIILKHNNTYLTAYAHNQALLVKEDQTVRKGQKIAEMGSTDTDRVKLHFEIRRQGKPVDPSRYLPAR
jgi:lipoprotein NlpD